MNFQDWFIEKKVQNHHIGFVNLLQSEQQKQVFQSLADQMATMRPSQTLGLEFLELVVDIISLKKENLIDRNFSDFDSWKKHLYSLRFPQTVARDQVLKEKLEQLSWPTQSKIKFERRGDRAGVELKTFITSSLDLKKLIAELERVQKDFP